MAAVVSMLLASSLAAAGLKPAADVLVSIGFLTGMLSVPLWLTAAFRKGT